MGGPAAPLRTELIECLETAAFDHIDLLVSFVMLSGIDLIGGGIEDALDRGARVRVLATDYLGVTEPSALAWLLDRSVTGTGVTARPGQLEVKVFSDPLTSFHPKAYLFWSSQLRQGQAFVGSSNMSRSGLLGGIEWNLRTVELPLLRAGFESLWFDARARDLTEEWLATYQPVNRQRPAQGRPLGDPPVAVADDTTDDGSTEPPPPEAAVDDASVAPAPSPIQAEALEALEATRAEGRIAGLVVMATGLGKTWLAAFDSNRPAYRRVLFLAHREEILRQARDVFRRVRPESTAGLFIGDERTPHTDIVFASVQSLVGNLDQFDRNEFDYVVDEFHHAAAPTYRKVIDHFVPSFLLGLTATPHRMDGADLLALCGDNVVFDCGLTEAIDRSELVPFHYWGVPDVVDFEPIPWRNGRFDPDALETAIATQERAEHAIGEWQKRRGSRTLAFCASTTHADFMAEQFRQRGIVAVAVHSKPTSAPRRMAIGQLAAGEIEVVCSVDVFNEGLDIPAVDTVLMLRPTASPIIFLQQLGRGLRRFLGKDHLRVIDFIGNHRSFLAKPRVLLSLGGRQAPTAAEVIDAGVTGSFELPAGCFVDYDLEAVDLIEKLRPPSTARDALGDYCRTFTDEHGVRPTAGQAWRSGLNPAATLKHDGWFAFLTDRELLTDGERAVVDRHAAFLAGLERTELTKSHKLITLRALIHEGGLRSGATLEAVAEAAQRMVAADHRLVADATTKELPSPATADAATWRAYWRRNPIAAWIGENRRTGNVWFRLDANHFGPAFDIAPDDEDTLAALVAELVEYRLARYLQKRRPRGDELVAMACRIGHAGGRPIIWLDRRSNSSMPTATVPFLANDHSYEGDFRKEALKVARSAGSNANDLHALLRGWFGPSAGLPGTNHRVDFRQTDHGWELRPILNADESGEERSLPFFPTFDVACGSFNEPSRVVHDATTMDLRLLDAVVDRDDHFVAFARGDSMRGGAEPIRHGDPLLFEWARSVDRRDLVGQRVLVNEHSSQGEAAVLKRLELANGEFSLASDEPSVAPIPGTTDLRVIARLVRRLEQREVNPIAPHIGEAHARRDIQALHGDPDAKTNWQQGHVTLPGQAIMLVTLDKAGMVGGADYHDHFDSVDTFIWSSQASTSPEGKRGREVLEALETATRLHLWARAKKSDREFRYLGLLLPVSHTGSKPMSVTFRLLTPLDDALRSYFKVS